MSAKACRTASSPGGGRERPHPSAARSRRRPVRRARDGRGAPALSLARPAGGLRPRARGAPGQGARHVCRRARPATARPRSRAAPARRRRSPGRARTGVRRRRGRADAAGADEAVVAWCDADYPPGLRELFDPPPALYLRGRAVAGDAARLAPAAHGGRRRRPTAVALRARDGLAAGRRPCARRRQRGERHGPGHRRSGARWARSTASTRPARPTATAADREPVAVALAGVLGAGVRLAVPRTNADLFVALERRGLLLSEYGWLLPPHPWRFPARNRVIAALADAVVIVEGGARSGALHTAAFAVDLGRDVLAVPGEAGRPLSAGPHRLLRDGAHLCEVARRRPRPAARERVAKIRAVGRRRPVPRGLERWPRRPRGPADGRRQGPERACAGRPAARPAHGRPASAGPRPRAGGCRRPRCPRSRSTVCSRYSRAGATARRRDGRRAAGR